MNTPKFQILRVLTGTTGVVLLLIDFPFWWIPMVIWAMLCILGIIATIPALIIIGFGAGAAQADWMSDAFVFGLLFVLPTILAVIFSEVMRRWNKGFLGEESARE